MTTTDLENIARAELVTLAHEPLVLAACVRAMQRAVAELRHDGLRRALAILDAYPEHNWGAAYNDIVSDIRSIQPELATSPAA